MAADSVIPADTVKEDDFKLAYKILERMHRNLTPATTADEIAHSLAEVFASNDPLSAGIAWFAPIFEMFGLKEKTVMSFANLLVSSFNLDQPAPVSKKRSRWSRRGH